MGNNLVSEIYAKYTLRTFGSILFIGLLLSILNLLQSDVVTVQRGGHPIPGKFESSEAATDQWRASRRFRTSSCCYLYRSWPRLPSCIPI